MSRNRAALLSFVIVTSVTALCVFKLDREVAVLCKYGITGSQFQAIEALTVIGDAKWWFYLWAATWLVCAVMTASGGPHREIWVLRRRTAGFLFANMVVGGLVIVAMKWGVGRYRPPALFEQGIYGMAPFSPSPHYLIRSFPSGHAQAMFSLATPLALLAPRWRPLLFLVAAGIGLTRVLISVHYLSDVLVGAYVGAGMTYVVLEVYTRWVGPIPLPRHGDDDAAEVTEAE